MDKKRLTESETLTLARRRLGWTQTKAANEYGVTYAKWSAWERGLEKPGAKLKLAGKLESYEVCFIRRRRQGKTQQYIADYLGRSRRWVNLMERGEAPDKELSEFWSAMSGAFI